MHHVFPSMPCYIRLVDILDCGDWTLHSHGFKGKVNSALLELLLKDSRVLQVVYTYILIGNTPPVSMLE